MNEKEVDAWAEWIESLIDSKIEQAFGRDDTHEYIRESALRKEIYLLMGQANKEKAE